MMQDWNAYYKSIEKPVETLTLNEWTRYRDILRKLSDKAADEFRDAVWNINGRWKGVGLGKIPRNDLIDYAYGLVTKYSEGSAAAACELYDAIAALQKANVPPAVPAQTPNYSQVAKTMNGVIKQTQNEEVVSATLGRMVKQTGQDTTLQNALRDGAEAAWIPNGDTCAYCISLASYGWRPVSKKALEDGHAKHIHANCDCAYAIRFAQNFQVDGYDPNVYKKMIEDAPLDHWNTPNGKPPEGLESSETNTTKNKINALRREAYGKNREKILEQKRNSYARRKALKDADETKV